MEKAIVNMTNWELYVYNDRYNLSGIADSHPNLGKDTYVKHIKELQKYGQQEIKEIRFNKETIRPGETKVFTPDNHCQGLISPDCYNGKSVLFGSAEKKEG